MEAFDGFLFFTNVSHSHGYVHVNEKALFIFIRIVFATIASCLETLNITKSNIWDFQGFRGAFYKTLSCCVRRHRTIELESTANITTKF